MAQQQQEALTSLSVYITTKSSLEVVRGSGHCSVPSPQLLWKSEIDSLTFTGKELCQISVLEWVNLLEKVTFRIDYNAVDCDTDA